MCCINDGWRMNDDKPCKPRVFAGQWLTEAGTQHALLKFPHPNHPVNLGQGC